MLRLRLHRPGQAPLVIPDPWALELTPAFLSQHSVDPLVVGDTVTWRFQVRDELDAAFALDGAGMNLVLSVYDRAEPGVTTPTLLFDRRSADDIVGVAPPLKEIAADAVQSSEDTTLYTGRGWFEIRFRPADELEAPQANLLPHVGLRPFGVRLESTADVVRTLARGRVQLVRPHTLAAQLP
jgi:hypothetical protein